MSFLVDLELELTLLLDLDRVQTRSEQTMMDFLIFYSSKNGFDVWLVFSMELFEVKVITQLRITSPFKITSNWWSFIGVHLAIVKSHAARQ